MSEPVLDRVLVTGNLGYVGPCVVRHLREVHPETTLVGLDAGFFAPYLTVANGGAPNVHRQLIEDVRNPSPEAVEGVDGVVQLAAISNDPIGNVYEDVTLEINHRATVELARRAKAAGARRFVLASSCSVYGAAGSEARREDSELNPLTAYARSKVLAERDLAELADDSFVVTCLRFATACGMSDRLRLDLVLNDFVASAVTSGRVTLLSDGSAWRPLIHVRDMARAIEWALTRPASSGGAFLAVNTGSDRWNYRIIDLAHAVREEVEGSEVVVGPDATPDARSYRVDFGLFESLAPEHQPRIELAEAVRELRDGLHAIRFEDSDFRSSHLIRLRVLESLRAEKRLTDRLEWVPA